MATTTTPGRSGEDGIALAFAVVIVAAIVGLTALLMVNARASEQEARLTSDRVLTQPHVQSAITGFRMALGARLATDADGYVLDAQDMAKLAPSQATASDFVTHAGQLPAEFRTVGGVWQKLDRDTMRQLAYPMPAVAFHETATADPATCARLGVAATSCNNGLHGFWQVYRVELPDRSSLDANGNVVAYFRAWLQPVDAGSRPTGTPSNATVIRAELRPGRFADYQLISDGQVQFGAGAFISGPVHSNGFELARNHLTDPDPATPLASIKVQAGARCARSGSLSTAAGPITMPVGMNCSSHPDTNRFISFLRVFDELDQLAADAARPGAESIVLPGYDIPSVPGRQHAWEVWLKKDQVRLRSPTGKRYTIPAGSGSTGILIEDDILLHGGDLDGRLTLGARRAGAGSADIFIDGDVNPRTTRPGRTLGLIAQGDIVVDMQGGQTNGMRFNEDCDVKIIRAAMIAASGGLTLPSQFTTQEIQSGPPQCSQTLVVDGSVAGHRSPNLQQQWSGWDDPVNYPGRWAGYADREYRWDTRLLSSPPPYFPLTGSWQAISVRVGNVDCYAGGRRSDAGCR